MESTIKVPEELKDFLEIESCADFDEKRYFKTRCQEEIYEAVCKANQIAPQLNKIGIKYANTTLLYGPSGTGKTTLGRYIAYRLNMDFAYLSFANIVDGVMGSTASNISKVFRFMENQAGKCIFMLDELDCIAVDRGREAAATGGELSRITITLMQELDRLKKNNSNLVVIAATNVLRNVDNAMRTRFSVKREVEGLKNSEKEAFIKQYLNNLAIKVDYNDDNIEYYVASNINAEQRTIEADMIQCLITWLDNGRKNYKLIHIEEEL